MDDDDQPEVEYSSWTYKARLTPEEQARADALGERLRNATTPEERDAAQAAIHDFLRERRSRLHAVERTQRRPDDDSDTEALCCFCMQTTTFTLEGDGVRLQVDRLGSSDSSGLYAHVECLRSRIHPEFPSDPPFE